MQPGQILSAVSRRADSYKRGSWRLYKP